MDINGIHIKRETDRHQWHTYTNKKEKQMDIKYKIKKEKQMDIKYKIKKRNRWTSVAYI